MVFVTLLTPHFALANCSDAYLPCVNRKVIRAIQLNLQDRGVFKGKVTGKYDAPTERALKQFSKENKVEFDRNLNKSLVKALWGVEIDYENATPEERIAFLKKIKVLKDSSASPDSKEKNAASTHE